MHARRRRRRGDDHRRHALRRRRARRLAGRLQAKIADVHREAVIDVALSATVPPRRPIEEVGDLVDAGAGPPSSSPRSRPTPSASRGSPMPNCCARSPRSPAPAGSPGVHAENDEIVRAGIAAEQAAGRGAEALAHARSRPPVAEHEAIARCLELARASRCAAARLPRVHAARRRARRASPAATGWMSSAETWGHYLLLDERELTAGRTRRRSTPRCVPPRCRPAAWTSSPQTTSAGRPSASTAPTSSALASEDGRG